MQLVYGSYDFKVNGVQVTTSQTTNLTEARVPYSVTNTINCDGYLEASGQAALTTAENGLKTALSRHFQDLILKQDSGANSAVMLRNATSLSGVIITAGPSFGDAKGPEYANQRHFVFTAEAEYVLANTFNLYMAFEETIAFSGGGPYHVMKRALNGPPQRQMIWEQTEYVAIQSGRAIGFRAQPLVPASIWPFALKEAPAITPKSPKRQGSIYRDYEVSWSYRHEWFAPLIGVPHFWPLIN